MIISHKHRFIFAHNPKAAGTSIRTALSSFHDDTRSFWHQGWLPTEERIIDLAHLTADLWTPLVERSYTSFGFVRDPYSRFKSGLSEVMRRHGQEFGTDPVEFVMERMTPANIRWDWRFVHLCPQHYFFYIGNKSRIDKICRIERIHADWGAVNSLLGLRIELPHERKVAEPGLYDGLLENGEVLERVNSLYLRDFQLFGYEMTGGIEVKHYSDRVVAIHDPSRIAFFSDEELEHIQFTAGEKVALRKRNAFNNS